MKLENLMIPNARVAPVGRQAFRQAMVDAIAGAAVEGRREITWVDSDFTDWPLDDALVLDALSRWARQPLRRLLLVAHSFQDVPRKHPRFTAWRRTFAHRVECRSAPELPVSDIPTLMLAGDLYSLQLLDKRHWRTRWLDDETDYKTWQGVVDAILLRSEVDFGANTLGL